MDALVFQSWDRLARSPALITTLNELMLKHGIVPISRHNLPRTLDCEELLNDFGAGISTAVDAQRSGNEVRELIRRNRMGMPKRLREKKLFPGNPNYGYKIEYSNNVGKIVDDPSAQFIIRLALLELYANQGLSASAVARELNGRGIQAPQGGQWFGTTLYALIKNLPVYCGKLRLNHRSETGRPVIEIDGSHTPVFTAEEADRILEARSLHKHERRVSKNYPLLSIVYCLTCRYPLHVYGSPHKRKDGKWRGSWRMRCKKCYRTIGCQRVMDAVVYAIQKIQVTDVTQLVDEDPVQNNEPRRIQLAQALSDLSAERQRLINGYVRLGVIPEEEFSKLSKGIAARELVLQAELSELETEIDQVKKRQSKIDRLNLAKSQADAMLDNLRNNTNPLAVRAWLHSFLRLYVDKTDDGQNNVVDFIVV